MAAFTSRPANQVPEFDDLLVIGGRGERYTLASGG